MSRYEDENEDWDPEDEYVCNFCGNAFMIPDNTKLDECPVCGEVLRD